MVGEKLKREQTLHNPIPGSQGTNEMLVKTEKKSATWCLSSSFLNTQQETESTETLT